MKRLKFQSRRAIFHKIWAVGLAGEDKRKKTYGPHFVKKLMGVLQSRAGEGVEQEEKWPNFQFKDHFPDSRSMGSRPLFWDLTSFPPLGLGP
jgi:hypothetical protein